VTGTPWLLAIDTATSVVVVAAGTPAGDLIEARTFAAGHRHGSHLLPSIEGLARDRDLAIGELAGVIVGTGPGAFTGLRVGLATGKTLAHALGVPIVGLSTGEALLAAAASAGDPATRLSLPAGLRDRVVVIRGEAPRLEAGEAAAPAAWAGTIAVDLEGRAPEPALEAGRRAVAALPATLLRLGAERLTAGATDDAERLVPEYVSLPRGVTAEPAGGVAWSRDPR
jgi:tRNA threonylcarbamoyladenosine biosynthesis protein TsaB